MTQDMHLSCTKKPVQIFTTICCYVISSCGTIYVLHVFFKSSLFSNLSQFHIQWHTSSCYLFTSHVLLPGHIRLQRIFFLLPIKELS